MASLHSFMIRMNYLNRSTPLSSRMRRRRFSSTTSSISGNPLADPNNNELLQPLINPSRKRRKLSACIYKPIGSDCEEATTADAAAQSPQLAVHLFEALPVMLRSEQAIPVSLERFLAFHRLFCPENVGTSMVYYIPRMVPVSVASTCYPSYDTENGTETIVHCTTVEFRRRYTPVAMQTFESEQQKEEDHAPRFVSYACWNVSEY